MVSRKQNAEDVEKGRPGFRQPLLSADALSRSSPSSSASSSSSSSPSSSPSSSLSSSRSRGRSREQEGFSGSVAIAVLCTAIVSLGPVQFGFCNGYSSPTQSGIMADLDMSVSQYSLFGSLSNVGGMLGAMLSGQIADFMGRKGALVAAAIPNMLGWLLIAITKDASMLYFGRILVGFGVGIISFTVPVYIAEIAPQHLRGGLGTANQFSVTIGILLAYVIGLVVNWRAMALAGALPCFLLILGLFFIPESPRWLAKIGKVEDFQASLQALRGYDADITMEVYEIQEATEDVKGQARVKLSSLLERKYYRPLVVGVGLLVFQQLSGINALMFYASSIFKAAGFSSANVPSLAISGVQVIMTGISAVLIDKAGRRILLMVSAGGMSVTCFLVGLSFYFKEHTVVSDQLETFIGIMALLSLLVYVISFSLGLGAIPWVIMSEVFPSNVKGLAGSLATLISWMCAWLVTMTFNIMLEWSSAGSFGIYALICAATVAFVAVYVPETKGKTLEEIQAFFT